MEIRTRMSAYKAPDFKERAALAQQAKQKALDRLKAKPPIDPAVVAERAAARVRREEAAAAKRVAKREAEEAARLAKIEAARLAAEQEEQAAKAAEQSEAEKKAARDARYAARKKRK
ncbi:hypothetical protein GCM10009106_16300 [Sphingomonas japonica]